MTAPAFLETLKARGVVLSLDPNAPSGLRYRAPRGVVTVEVADRIRRTAPHLISLLPPTESAKTAPDAYMPLRFATSPVQASDSLLGTDVPKSEVQTAHNAAPCESEEGDAYAELREQERTEALLLDACQALWSGRLAVGSFQLEPSRWVTNPARWLQWAVSRRKQLLCWHGPTWWDTPDGQILARDLYTFAEWYEVVGLADPGEGAPVPPALATLPAPHEPHAALF